MKKTDNDFTLNQSQQWFIDALLALMKTKPFHKIQIKELAEKAGANIPTGYTLAPRYPSLCSNPKSNFDIPDL